MNMTQPVDPQLVKLFLERLRSGAEEEQLQAATQLSRLQIRTRGTVRTRGSLARSAGSPYPAELGREAMQSVLEALQHESPAVRKEVIAALGEIGDEQTVAILSTIAIGDRQDPDEEIRRAAIAALGTLGGPTAVNVLCQAAEHDPSEANRYDALIALNDLILSEQHQPAIGTRGGIRVRGARVRTRAAVRSEVQPIVESLQHLRDKASEKEYLRRMAGAVLAQLAE